MPNASSPWFWRELLGPNEQNSHILFARWNEEAWQVEKVDEPTLQCTYEVCGGAAPTTNRPIASVRPRHAIVAANRLTYE